MLEGILAAAILLSAVGLICLLALDVRRGGVVWFDDYDRRNSWPIRDTNLRIAQLEKELARLKVKEKELRHG